MIIKKIIAAVTSAVMLFCSGAAFPANAVDISLPEAQVQSVGAVVDSGTCGENLTWTLDDEGTLTISGEGEMDYWGSVLNVPWYSKYGKMSKIKKVIIENGVTNISAEAFYDCYNLTSITIPDSVTSIGDNAFWCCSNLESITIPDSVTSIETYAFFRCSSLTSIIIPDSVTVVGYGAFDRCSNLTSVVIGDSVTIIGEFAFGDCSSLESITILNPNCKIYDSVKTIYNNVDSNKFIYTGVIRGYTGSTAQAYAEKFGRTFEAIDDETTNTSTTTTTTTQPQDIIIHIGETIAIPGINEESTNIFTVDGDNLTALKVHKQAIEVNGEYRKLSIIPPEVTVYANDKKISPGGTLVYEEGLTIKFVVSNYFGSDLIEENPTWKIYEDRQNPNTGKIVEYSGGWNKLISDTPDNQYIVQGNTLVVIYNIKNAPTEDITGYLGWHLSNQYSIYFKDNSFTLSLTAPKNVCGDANGDGEVKLNDAVLIMQALSNPNKFGIDGTDNLHISAEGWANADCNNPGDGVTGKDALAVQKLMLSLIEILPER